MPYMIEYTLFATLAFHHLIIGIIVLAFVSIINKVLIKNAEFKSWVWMTAFIVVTVTPFALISNDHVELNQVQTNRLLKVVEHADSAVLNNAQHTAENETNTRFNIDDSNLSAAVNDLRIQFWHLRPSIVFDYSIYFTVALIIWLIGSLWRVGVLTLMWSRTQKLTQNIGQFSDELSAYLGIPVYISQSVVSPMVLGYLNPKIVIPQSIIDLLQDQQIRAILQHEKAHIERKDNFFGLFQELIAIAFWWSPIMRMLNKNVHVEREIACDIRAANNCQSPKQYAQSLLDCAKLMVHQNRSILAMGLFSKKKELTQRIKLVLTQARANKIQTPVIAVVCVFFSIACVQAAQAFVPNISVKQTTIDALHYSILPIDEGQALIRAVTQNDIGVIEDLQSHGVNIDTPALGDGTALMIAVKTGNLPMAEALIKLGASVDQSSRGDGNPLIVAAMRNNVDAAQLLLSYGANIDAVVPGDETALITASSYSNLEMVEFLLLNGANANIAVTTGGFDGNEVRTALSRAKSDQVRELLLAYGATQ